MSTRRHHPCWVIASGIPSYAIEGRAKPDGTGQSLFTNQSASFCSRYFLSRSGHRGRFCVHLCPILSDLSCFPSFGSCLSTRAATQERQGLASANRCRFKAQGERAQKGFQRANDSKTRCGDHKALLPAASKGDRLWEWNTPNAAAVAVCGSKGWLCLPFASIPSRCSLPTEQGGQRSEPSLPEPSQSHQGQCYRSVTGLCKGQMSLGHPNAIALAPLP